MARHGSRAPLELILCVGLIASAWAAHSVGQRLEALRSETVESGDLGPLPNGKVLRVAALGFERLVADLYWIRSLFYIGSDAARDANYPAAERLAELVTDLDPQFASAYVLMGSVLGALRYDPDAAIRLLEKGAANTRYWKIHFHLGFQYFMEKGDYRKGAESLQRAYDLGGPQYLPLLISRLYAHGGELDSAILFLRERLRQERFPELRERLERRLRDVSIQRDLSRMQAALERYQQERGQPARDLAALVEAGLWKGPLEDPAGLAYRVEAGRAVCDTPFEKLELKE